MDLFLYDYVFSNGIEEIKRKVIPVIKKNGNVRVKKHYSRIVRYNNGQYKCDASGKSSITIPMLGPGKIHEEWKEFGERPRMGHR